MRKDFTFCHAFVYALVVFVVCSKSISAQNSEIFPVISDDFNQSITDTNLNQTFAHNPLALQNSIKITVNKDGWYRINRDQLINLGFDMSENSEFIQLFSDGVEHAIIVSGKYIQFYGQKNDTYWTDKKVYWLAKETSLGKRITSYDGGSFDENVSLLTYQTLAEKKDKAFRASGILNGEQDNFYVASISTNPVNLTLNLQNPAISVTENPVLEFVLQGATVNIHNLNIKLNGVDLGNITYNYKDRFIGKIPVNASDLLNGNNTITFTTTSAYFDASFLEFVQVRYVREAKAIDNSLKFDVAANQSAKIVGFSDPKFLVYDITDVTDVKQVDFERNYNADESVAFTLTKSEQPRKILAEPRNFLFPLEVKLNTESNLIEQNNQADFIILTHHNFQTALEQLKTRRESQGLQTKIVDIEDVYDEFSFGVKTPQAIRAFLQNAKNTWQIPPRYLLLVGDSSVDPRGYLATSGEDFIPILLFDGFFMEASSDDLLSDFNGDSIADIPTGRFSVRTLDEAEILVNKTLDYDDLPVGSTRQRGALLVSDRIESYNFQEFTNEVRTSLPRSLSVRMINRTDAVVSEVRSSILTSINQGTGIINFLGHGNLSNWTSANLLQTNDALSFQNNSNTTIFVMLACLNGAYAETQTTLAESIHKTGTGGAIAVWASSGQTYPYGQVAMTKAFYRKIFSTSNIRIGDATNYAKTQNPDLDIRKFSILFGDPTMIIKN